MSPRVSVFDFSSMSLSGWQVGLWFWFQAAVVLWLVPTSVCATASHTDTHSHTPSLSTAHSQNIELFLKGDALLAETLLISLLIGFIFMLIHFSVPLQQSTQTTRPAGPRSPLDTSPGKPVAAAASPSCPALLQD